MPTITPNMCRPDGSKSCRRVIEVEDKAEGHGPANQAASHIAPKPTDPAASVATNRSGSDEMEGMWKKLTPSQVVKNSRHQAKSQRNSKLRRIGWAGDRNALSKLIMRRKNDGPWGDSLANVLKGTNERFQLLLGRPPFEGQTSDLSN